MPRTRQLLLAGLLLASPVVAGCDSNVGKGAAIGAAGGAGMGALGPGSILGNAAARRRRGRGAAATSTTRSRTRD